MIMNMILKNLSGPLLRSIITVQERISVKMYIRPGRNFKQFYTTYSSLPVMTSNFMFCNRLKLSKLRHILNHLLLVDTDVYCSFCVEVINDSKEAVTRDSKLGSHSSQLKIWNLYLFGNSAYFRIYFIIILVTVNIRFFDFSVQATKV